MTEFIQQDLSGARFEQVRMPGATFHEVDLTGADLREVALAGLRVRGALLDGIDLSGDFESLIVNGVDVAPLVEAELNRRDPERPAVYGDDPESFRAGWDVVERRWRQTIDRARELPPAWLDEGVDDEWSFIQTLRHLSFVIASWIEHAALEVDAPWDPLDLPAGSALRNLFTFDDARPGLDEVVALLDRRFATARGLVAGLDDEGADRVVHPTKPGWPDRDEVSVRECLFVAITELYEHHLFATRDLPLVIARHDKE